MHQGPAHHCSQVQTRYKSQLGRIGGGCGEVRLTRVLPKGPANPGPCTRNTRAANAARKPGLKEIAGVIASSCINGVVTQGREIPEVLAALGGSPALAAIKRCNQQIYLGKCRKTLAPYADPDGVAAPRLWAMLGAAEALSHATVVGDLSEEQAHNELRETIIALVKRSR